MVMEHTRAMWCPACGEVLDIPENHTRMDLYHASCLHHTQPLQTVTTYYIASPAIDEQPDEPDAYSDAEIASILRNRSKS